MENIETGLLLMVVGMATVFIILLIIIYIGKGLILAVNKYVPEEVSANGKAKNSRSASTNSPAAIPNQEAAAIVAAISVITHGKGKITRIEKI